MGYKTPLFAEYGALGARIVPFSGWDMPLHYGPQVREYHQVRLDAGMFDVSHMQVIDLEGNDALDLLHRLIANDPARLEVPGKALYGCVLNRRGGVIDDLILYFLAPTPLPPGGQCRHRREGPGLDTWPGSGLGRRDPTMAGLGHDRGPGTERPDQSGRPAPRGAARKVTGSSATRAYTGEDGFEVICPAGGRGAFAIPS